MKRAELGRPFSFDILSANNRGHPSSQPTPPILGREAPCANRDYPDSRGAARHRSNQFCRHQRRLRNDCRLGCGSSLALWAWVPVESRRNLSAFRDQSPEPLEVFDSRRRPMGRSVPDLVVPDPPRSEIERRQISARPTLSFPPAAADIMNL
jgi:hypothetical protein